MKFPASGKNGSGSRAGSSNHWIIGFLVFQCLELLFLTGCSRERGFSGFDGARALDETAQLVAIRPRDAGSPGARRAAEHLEQKLTALGFKATIDTFTQETPGGTTTFHNVLGRLPGKTDRVIVLGSHFDTKSGISPDFQGANDSGSSCGALLELARVLSESGPLETDVLVAFFDGEECAHEYGPRDGLHGSRQLARQFVESGGAPYVEAVIILDMIGDRDLTVSVDGSKRMTQELFAAAHEAGTRSVFSLSRSAILDDHLPFLQAGMPAVDVIDFKYGSAPGLNDYWHTMKDSMDKLSAESLQVIGDTVLQMIEQLQDNGE